MFAKATLTGFIVVFMVSFIIYNQEYDSTKADLSGGEILRKEIAFINEHITYLKKISEERIFQKVSENLSFNELLNDSQLDPKEQWEKIAQALGSGIVKKIRSESHRLSASRNNKKSKSISLIDAVSLKEFHLKPFVFLVLYTTYSASIVYDDERPFTDYFSLVSNALFMGLGLYVTSNYLSTRRYLKEGKVLAIVVLLGIYCQLVVLISQYIFWGWADLLLVASALPWIFCLFLGINFVYSVFTKNSKNDILQKMILEDLTDEKRILEEHRIYVENEIAKHLHGHMMLRYHQAKLKLDSAGMKGNFEISTEVIADLLEGFSIDSLRSVIAFDEDPRVLQKRLKEGWAFFISVSYRGDLSAYDDFPASQRLEIYHAIGDLISNA